MRNLINYILNMKDWIIQEITYRPSDIRDWRKTRKRHKILEAKVRAICKKAGIDKP